MIDKIIAEFENIVGVLEDGQREEMKVQVALYAVACSHDTKLRDEANQIIQDSQKGNWQ